MILYAEHQGNSIEWIGRLPSNEKQLLIPDDLRVTLDYPYNRVVHGSTKNPQFPIC